MCQVLAAFGGHHYEIFQAYPAATRGTRYEYSRFHTVSHTRFQFGYVLTADGGYFSYDGESQTGDSDTVS